jgi:hypothetical protein
MIDEVGCLFGRTGDRGVAAAPQGGPCRTQIARRAKLALSERLCRSRCPIWASRNREVVDSLCPADATGKRSASSAFVDFLLRVEAVAVLATAGLHLAPGLGLGPGDEVIVPVHIHRTLPRWRTSTTVFADVARHPA